MAKIKKNNTIVEKENYAILRIRKQNTTIDVIIDKEDIEKVSRHSWAARQEGHAYRVYGYVNGKNQMLYRYLLNYTGPLTVDHINRNTLDNRKNNLRIVTRLENSHNIDWSKVRKVNNKWKSGLYYYGEYYFVGYFDTEKEAIAAKMNKLEELKLKDEQLTAEYIKKKERKQVNRNISKWVLVATKQL